MSLPARAYYSALNRAVNSKNAYVDKMLAVFEFFLPQMFMHDNNRGQYYTMLASMPLPGRIFQANYEEIGDHQPGWEHPPSKTPECGISLECFAAMKQVCNW